MGLKGVQLDEAHSKLCPEQEEWVHTALAKGAGFCSGSTSAHGPRARRPRSLRGRRKGSAAAAVSHRWGIPCCAPAGRGHRVSPRRRGHIGRKPKPRLVAPKGLFYAQVVKGRNKTGQVVKVSRRVGYGGPTPFCQAVAPSATWGDDSNGVHGTVVWHAARAGGPLRRWTRRLSWRRGRHRGRV